MKKQNITESELRNKVASLREYMLVVEAGGSGGAAMAQQRAAAAQPPADPNQPSAATNFATGVGDALGTAAGVVAAPARAVWDAAKGVWNHAGEIGQGIAKGWNKTDPATMLGLDKTTPATTQGTKPPAKLAPGAKPTGKSDPAVLKQQQDLIAKGAKIKADGIMGPATQAAIKQFGAVAGATTAPVGQGTQPAPAAPAPAAPAAPATPAAPSPYAGSPEQEKIWNGLTQQDKDWLTKGGGKPNLTDPYIMARAPNGGKAAPAAAAPVAATPAAAAPAAPAAPATLTPQQQAQNVMQPGYATESTGFQNEELSRIVSLIHHR